MSPSMAGIAVLVTMLGLLGAGTPIAFALGFVAVAALVLSEGFSAIGGLSETFFAGLANFGMVSVPMFILMGAAVASSPAGRDLYEALDRWLYRVPGGMVMSNIGACALFAALSGSSPATCAAIGKMGIPEMTKRGYPDSLAAGSIAAGGTLGILIPPSVILVLYALMAEMSIATMFVAAMVPGVLAALGYMAAIAIFVARNPDDGPAGPRATWAQRMGALRETWSLIVIFALVIVGMYRGWFTPTEAAAVGAFGTGVLAVLHGGMRLTGIARCLHGTATTSAMIFLILLGAETFNAFLAQTRTPMLLAEAIRNSGLTPMLVLLAMLALYLVLGCVMDSMSMLLLTIPIFYPIIAGLDFGMPREETLIWFGILSVVVVEVGLITPPVGMNVFVINGMARDVPMIESFRGVLPFLISDIIRIAALIAFPVVTLGLVRLLG